MSPARCCIATGEQARYLSSTAAPTLSLGAADRTQIDANNWRFANWGGTGVNALMTMTGRFVVNAGGIGNGQPASCFTASFTFDKTVYLRFLRLGDFDGPNFELLWDVDPPFSSVPGNFRNNQCTNNHGGACRRNAYQGGNRGCVRSTSQNQSGNMIWNFIPATGFNFSASWPTNLGIGFGSIGVRVSDPYRLALLQICNGVPQWVDAITGTALTAAQRNSLRDNENVGLRNGDD